MKSLEVMFLLEFHKNSLCVLCHRLSDISGVFSDKFLKIFDKFLLALPRKS